MNHGVAVLLEVEAVLTDRGRGQHERPEERIERLTHNAIGLSRAQRPASGSTRRNETLPQGMLADEPLELATSCA